MDTQQYKVLHETGAYTSVKRTIIEVSGEDRVSFLHNLCTNDVRRLEPGRGCEAFFTNVQGKILCHALLFCRADSIVIHATDGHAQTLLPHLDKYLIREDVVLSDLSDSSVFLLTGPTAKNFLQQHEVPSDLEVLAHCETDLDGARVQVRRAPLVQVPCFILSCGQEHTTKLQNFLHNASIHRVDADIFEIVRIENGFPSSGCDITAENFPQEVGRDQLAISFTKGCYLGQETVARIDALGHVNRYLVSLQFDGSDVPPKATELKNENEVVGKVTSACFSPKLQKPIALGYVRREVIERGGEITSAYGLARIFSSNG